MKAPANCPLIGRWRIIEADLWDRAKLADLLALAIRKAKTRYPQCENEDRATFRCSDLV